MCGLIGEFDSCHSLLAVELEATPEQVRHLDEERSTVAAETRFKTIRERAEAVVIRVVIVANVE